MSAQHTEKSLIGLYEGDQSKLYSGVLLQHDDIQSQESKSQVKKIWSVTGILAIVTIIEVVLGLYFHSIIPKPIIITLFLLLTLFKAFYIVKVFMHLGDEKKSFVYFVLTPLYMFIWIVISFLMDGAYSLHMNSTFADTIKDIFK